MGAEQLLTAVLGDTGYRARARSLRQRKGSFTPKLIEGFVRHAHEAMRRDPAQARQCARLGLYVARSIGDTQAKIACLRALAQAATIAGRHPEALRAADEAIVATRLGGDPLATADLKVLRVQALTQLDRYVEARETGLRALRVFEEHEHVRGMIRTRMALGDLAIQLQRPREALRHYRHVEWLLPEDVKPRLKAVLAANRANALQGCNRFRAAARWFERARALFAEEGCEHTVAQMDYNLAYAAVLRGHFEEALVRYERVEQAFEQLRDDMHAAHVDLDRAEIHLQLNLPDDARGYAERAASRFEALGLVKDLAQAEYFAGRAAAMAGEFEAAVGCYDAARRRFEELGLLASQVGCMVQQAYVSHRLGRSAEAGRLAEEASALIGPDTNPLTDGQVALLRANLALAAGRAGDALHDADLALARCRRVHAPWLHIEAQRIIGRAHVTRRHPEHGILAYRAAIDMLERYRGGVPPDEYMTAFLSGRAELYEEIVELLVARGEFGEALEYAERAKSRALLDLLARRDPSSQDDGARGRRIRFLREALNAAYWKIFRSGGGPDAADSPAVAAAHTRAAALEDEMALLLRQQSLCGDRGARASTDAPTVREIQRDLDGDTVLVDYLLTRGGLIAFVVTRDALHVVREALDEGEIEERLQRFRFHLAKHERPALVAEDLVLRATRDNLARLAGRLLDPIARHLRGRRLVICPHGPLHRVPFHALPWGDDWLGDAFEILYAPSAAVYRHCAARRPRAAGPPSVFGVPDPDAPQIETEVRRVGELLATPHVFLGPSATLGNLRAAAASARVLHVATHGMFRRANPALSAIQLADGWITLHDLYSLRVRGELVVLSTCESGTAGVSAGGEILGLTRGFLYAGTRALLASQWRVRDETAARFMRAFYKALDSGADAAAAQRAAMAAVRRDQPHPYYWAPFFLLGCPVETNVDAAPAVRETTLTEANPR